MSWSTRENHGQMFCAPPRGRAKRVEGSRLTEMYARVRIALQLAVLISMLPVAATADGAWHVDLAHHRVISRPTGIFRDEKAGAYVTCTGGEPQFAILERDPIAAKGELKLQFGGHQGRMVLSVGTDGVIRKYSISRGRDAHFAVTNAHDSRDIVSQLLLGPSRIAWIVDTEDGGLDSLAVPASGFVDAWHQLNCGSK